MGKLNCTKPEESRGPGRPHGSCTAALKKNHGPDQTFVSDYFTTSDSNPQPSAGVNEVNNVDSNEASSTATEQSIFIDHQV